MFLHFCSFSFIFPSFVIFLHFFITLLRRRDPKQRFLSTSVGRSLVDDAEDDDGGDDDVDDVEAERTRVRSMIEVLRS